MLSLVGGHAFGISITDHAKEHPLKLFVATKGVEMPNTTDQTNNLAEGDRALLLSGQDISDLAGISTLMVEDEGRQVPVTSVKNLHLFLNKNAITVLPDEMSALKNVVFLYLEYNKLSALPRALLEMDALAGMYFTANDFAEIPAFVFEMTRLKKLQFSKNHIRVLPETLGNLDQLRHFNVADNQIAVIPESISKLEKLRVCDLSDNPITALPEAFGKVKIVNQLRVRNCPINALPIGFASMRATIDITGTKIDPAKLPLDLRAKISTEKPPGSKEPEKMIVKPGKKP